MNRFLSLLAGGLMLVAAAQTSNAQVSFSQIKLGTGSNILTLQGPTSGNGTFTFPAPSGASTEVLTTSGGQTVDGTLTAAADNDWLRGLWLNPTFSDNSHTGVTHGTMALGGDNSLGNIYISDGSATAKWGILKTATLSSDQTYTLPATGGTLLTSSNAMVYGGSNNTLTTGGTHLFDISYGTVSPAADGAGAFITVDPTNGGAVHDVGATGLTVSATADNFAGGVKTAIALALTVDGSGTADNYEIQATDGVLNTPSDIATNGLISAGSTITATDGITSGDNSSHAGSLTLGDGAAYTSVLKANTTASTTAVIMPAANGTLVTAGSSATLQSTPVGSYSTTSGSLVQSGKGGTLTPTSSGKVLLIVSGLISNTSNASGTSVRLSYGAGSSVPTAGTAATGTAAGALYSYIPNANGETVPFTQNAVITGLTVGTAYWFDLQIGVTGGTGTISGLSFSAVELP